MRGNRRGDFVWAGSNPGGGTGINGARIDDRPATSAVWIDDDNIAEQLQLSAAQDIWRVVRRPASGGDPVELFPHGANVVCAGYGVTSGWLSRPPGGSATWGKLPDGCWLMDVSPFNGWTAICPDYSQGRNIELRDAEGEIVRTIVTDALTTESAQFANVRFGDGVIAFITAGNVSHVHDLENGLPLPLVVKREGVHYIQPVTVRGELWLFERSGGEATAELMLRRATEPTGIIVATTNAFEPAAVVTDAGLVACGWMSEQGATPERFRRADIVIDTPEPPQPPTHDHTAAIAALNHAKADIDRAIALLNQEQRT